MSEQSLDYAHLSTESVLQVTHERLARMAQELLPDYLRKSHEEYYQTPLGSLAVRNTFRLVNIDIAGILPDTGESIVLTTQMDLDPYKKVDTWRVARDKGCTIVMRGAGMPHADRYVPEIWPDGGFSLESRSGNGSLDMTSIGQMARFVQNLCLELEKPTRGHLALVD